MASNMAPLSLINKQLPHAQSPLRDDQLDMMNVLDFQVESSEMKINNVFTSFGHVFFFI